MTSFLSIYLQNGILVLLPSGGGDGSRTHVLPQAHDTTLIQLQNLMTSVYFGELKTKTLWKKESFNLLLSSR